jgi:hypothetical protein
MSYCTSTLYTQRFAGIWTTKLSGQVETDAVVGFGPGMRIVGIEGPVAVSEVLRIWAWSEPKEAIKPRNKGKMRRMVILYDLKQLKYAQIN